MSELTLHGQGSSHGIAIGHVYSLPATPLTPHYWITHREMATELKRLAKALQQTKSQWKETEERLSRFYAKDQSHILESHQMLLQDEMFKKMAEHYIKDYQINAEWALELTRNHLKITFASGSDGFASKRIEDIDAVLSKILDNLVHPQSLQERTKAQLKNCILVTESLSPAAIANLPRDRILGFVTSKGGLTSHSIILARSLRIPAVSGIENIHQRSLAQKKVILDGFEGKLLVNPNKTELKRYRELAMKHQLLEKLLLKEAQEPAFTKDGKPICIEANVELLEEIPSLLKFGAEGIGLFRTESLFWNPLKPPPEETQVKLYERLLIAMKGRPVTLRTLDVSGEDWLQTEVSNPALGLRGIRFGLKERLLLKTQLRAMLRASLKGPLKILLPMVGRLEEVEEFKALFQEVCQELQKEKLPIRRRIPLGVMIEVPSACLIADALSKKADFFAIGTNDLIQYTLALDRTNEHVASLYTPLHPAVLKILNQVIGQAKKAKKEVLLCGELAGDPLFLPLLIGMGLSHFSMNTQSIPKAKKIVRSLSTKKCRKWAQKLLSFSRIKEIEKMLKTLSLELDTP